MDEGEGRRRMYRVPTPRERDEVAFDVADRPERSRAKHGARSPYVKGNSLSRINEDHGFHSSWRNPTVATGIL